MSGTLYLVPNTLDFGTTNADAIPADLQEVLPLGVVRIAARLGFWVAENAKTTRAFLKRVDTLVPLTQPLQTIDIAELPRPQKGAKVATAIDWGTLLAPALQGRDMGLISEAGLPAVADPGSALVHAAHLHGVRVEPLSGPSSLLLGLAASGLNGQSFAFVGYLPVEAAERQTRIRELETLSRRLGQTQMFIETPYRNEALLGALLASLNPQTRLSVSCGLTLPGGWTRSDTVRAWQAAATPLPKDIPVTFGLLAT